MCSRKPPGSPQDTPRKPPGSPKEAPKETPRKPSGNSLHHEGEDDKLY